MKLPVKLLLFILCSILIYSQQNEIQKDYPPNSNRIITTLNFKDTDIRDVLRSVAFEYQTNINIENDVNKRISVTLFNIQVFDAVKIIVEDNNLNLEYDQNRFIITQRKAPLKVEPIVIEPEAEVVFSKEKLSIKADNVEAGKFVEQLRVKTKKNYMLTPGTTGRITGTLENIDLETGLKNILLNNGFILNIKDSIYYISRSAYFSSLSNDQEQTRYKDYWVNAKHNLVTVDVNQVSLDKVISDIAQQLGLQIVKLANPTNNTTVKFTELPVDEAFNLLFYGTEFTFRANGKIFIIGNKAAKNLDNTHLIKLQYLKADKIQTKLPPNLIQSLTINTSLEHNALIVTGARESITSLEDYIKTIDKPVPQVLIEALVVDYNLDNTRQLGIKIGKGDSSVISKIDKFFPGVDVTASGNSINKWLKDIGKVNVFGKDFDVAKLGKLPTDFYVNLKALENMGLANVKSKPLLSTLNGYSASLKIGTVQNYVFNEIMPIQNQLSSSFIERERIEKIEANMSFEITPWIGPNDELTLEIKFEFQTPVGEFNPDKKNIPAINTRTFSSTVRLIDGETIVLGGLIQESEINSEEKTPFLSDIPFLGELFKSSTKRKTKGELIMYLTPRIYYGDESGYQQYNFSK